MAFSANFESHQKWRRNIPARIPRALRDHLRSDHCPIATERALDINAEHFDRIVIFKSNTEFARQADLHLRGQYEIGIAEARRVALVGRASENGPRRQDGRIVQVCALAPTETGRCPIGIRNCFARDNQRLARRGMAIERFLGNQAAEKS